MVKDSRRYGPKGLGRDPHKIETQVRFLLSLFGVRLRLLVQIQLPALCKFSRQDVTVAWLLAKEYDRVQFSVSALVAIVFR